jgi:hypothetical protein
LKDRTINRLFFKYAGVIKKEGPFKKKATIKEKTAYSQEVDKLLYMANYFFDHSHIENEEEE